MQRRAGRLTPSLSALLVAKMRGGAGRRASGKRRLDDAHSARDVRPARRARAAVGTGRSGCADLSRAGDHARRAVRARGSASTAARAVADKMSETLGQQIVIDNRGGAGGTVATRAVAKSAPDGYTLLVVTSATVGTSPSLFQNLGYDPRKDFAPIGLIAGTPNLIVVHPSFPARSLAELVKIGKETAAPIPYGSPGTGTLNHLTVELLAYRTGMKLSHVAYKGAGPALNDLLGGHIGVLISATPNAHSHVLAGTIHALAVTGAKRSDLLPAVPTFAEAGFPGYDVPLRW